MDISPKRNLQKTPHIDFFGAKKRDPSKNFSKVQPKPIFIMKNNSAEKVEEKPKKKSTFAFSRITDDDSDDKVRTFKSKTVTFKFINLPVNMTSNELNDFILKKSKICPLNAFIVLDKETKKSLRYGYVVIQGEKNSDAIYELFDGLCYKNCVISVIHMD